MKVAFTSWVMTPTGGMELAIRRLATSLVERGHDVLVLYGTGTAPPSNLRIERQSALAAPGPPTANERSSLDRTLEAFSPDITVTAGPSPWLLDVTSSISPTVATAHDLSVACPDGSRYWSRTGRACRVQAGWKCVALRPVLGCSGMPRVLQPAHVSRYRTLRETFLRRNVGVVTPSTEVRALVTDHGFDPARITVLPTLGMRASEDELARAAGATPVSRRSRVAYLGRLAETKGAQLLPSIEAAMGDRAPLLVHGEGYLRGTLSAALRAGVGPPLTQTEVAGLLLWARGVVFPSLWPEPGGIVGIDAQLFGVPVGAFAIGGPRDWPAAELFSPGDARALGQWAGGLPAVSAVRNVERVHAAQSAYWRTVGDLAGRRLQEFADHGTWASDPGNPVRESLVDALPGFAG